MRLPTARFLLLAALLALAAGSCRGVRAPEIHGLVTPRSPVTLPEAAVLEVQVADVTRTDEAPVVVARRTYSGLGPAPWRFTLRADSLAALDPAHAYAVQARVLVDGKPRLVSKRRTLVDPAKLADTLEVVVEPVPRTVGWRPGGSAPGAARAWNPPGRPATLREPISPPITGFAGGPPSAPPRAAHA